MSRWWRIAVQMGIYTVDADLLGLAGGRRELLACHEGVYRDDCDVPVPAGGDPATGITASTLSVVDAASMEGATGAPLRRIDHRLDCPARTDDGLGR